MILYIYIYLYICILCRDDTWKDIFVITTHYLVVRKPLFIGSVTYEQLSPFV